MEDNLSVPGEWDGWKNRFLIVFSALLTSALLLFLICIGRTSSGMSVLANGSVSRGYDMFMTNRVSDALEGVLAVKKVYWIGQHEQQAPVPDPDRYGEANDPAELQWLLDAAAPLLEGQETYFGTQTKLMPGTSVRYYLDDTIFAVTWKEAIDGGAYTFSEICIAHPSQFRRFVGGGDFASDKLFFTTEMAESVNAVVASSGDFYRFRMGGVLVYDSQVRWVSGWTLDTCYIDGEGDLHFTTAQERMTEAEAKEFVEANDIRFSLAFGPILVRNGERVDHVYYPVGEIADHYPRAALCQMGKRHYLLAAVNHEGPYESVPDIASFARNIQKTGCVDAYALDGGQTAAIVMNNELVNRVLFGSQRKISDILYFATAIPNG